MTKLDTEDTYLNDLFRKQAVYQIPEFQRAYSWEEKHLRDLWTDLKQAIAFDRDHHLDQIKLVPNRDVDPTTHQVIDGQQRLTTLSLIICAMRDIYEQRGGPEKYVVQLQELLEAKDKDANRVRRLKLLEGTGDDENYRQLFENGSTDSVDGNIAQAYDFYRSRLEQCDSERLNEFREYVIDRLSIVVLTVGSMFQAYVMFEGNGRGLDLTPIEMSKSVIMKTAHRRDMSNSDTVKRLWAKILGLAESADPSKPRRAVNDVLLVTDRFDTPNDLTGDGFVRHIQHIFSNETDEPVEDVLSWLVTHLEEYERIKQANVTSFHKPQNARINSLIRQFTVKNSYAGLVLFWLFENRSQPGKLIPALDWCSKLSMRLYLADMTAYKKRDAVQGVWQDLKNGIPAPSAVKNQMRNYTPNDKALEIELNRRELSRNRATRNVLYRIEAEHFNGAAVGGSDYPTAGEDIEVEHIAPMQAFSADKYLQWRSVFNGEQDRFESHRKRLGNLTLLRSRRNVEAGTEPFSEKCDYYEKSDFEMSRKVDRRYGSWDFSNISERTSNMANLAVRTFSAGSYTSKPVDTVESDGGIKLEDYVGESDD